MNWGWRKKDDETPFLSAELEASAVQIVMLAREIERLKARIKELETWCAEKNSTPWV
jgi:hypothetical protein